MIKFISYTGKYPNLCSGVLTVDIDGKIVEFGSNFDKFWTSGGCCGFTDDYDDYAETGKWEFSYNDDKVIPNWIDKEELLKVFNENVEFGCCGGCL